MWWRSKGHGRPVGEVRRRARTLELSRRFATSVAALMAVGRCKWSMVLIEHFVIRVGASTGRGVPSSETLYELYNAILCYMCEMLNHCYLAELCCGAKVAVSGLP